MHTMRTVYLLIASLLGLWSSEAEARDLGYGEHRSPPGQWPEEGAFAPVRRAMADVRDRFQRESPKDHMSTFMQQMEKFLGKLVPSKELVQDLMGMPEPESSDVSNDISEQVNDVLSRAGKRKPHPPAEPPHRMLSPPPPAEKAPFRILPRQYPAPFTPLRSAPYTLPVPMQGLSGQSLARPALPSPPSRPLAHRLNLGLHPQAPPLAARPQQSLFSKIPIMMHEFAEDWFRRAD